MNEHDSADDSTAQNTDDEYRDADGPFSRRSFLKATGGVGAGALALGTGVSPAAALQEDCSSFGTLSVGGGDYQLVNNDWGSSDVNMCIWKESDGSYGYQWDTRTSGGEPNYPQALVGTKPWGSDTGVADFPIRRGDVDQLEMTVDVDQNISGGHNSSGWDLAEEWWLMEQPPSQATGTHVHECMMVLDWGGGHGHYMEERNVWTDKYGNTIDYWANYSGGGTNANFHIFRVRGGMTTGQVDLKPVIDYLSQRHGIGDDLWLSGIELGNEYWEGTQGDVTFNQFDVTINGTTYSSGGGSGGTSGGSGGTGGGTDDTSGGSNDGSGSIDGGSRSPYGGSPHSLPGRIQAEDFDEGGEGTAYHDTTSGSEGGAYRSTDVDIESATEGGYDIGWIQSGEWWTYTVDVDSSGTYDLQARVASNAGGGSLQVEVDGSQAGSTSFAGTGGWQSWTTVSLGTANLSAGEHVVRVRSDAGGWNLNWIEFGSSGGAGSSDGGSTDSGGSNDGGSSNDGSSDGGTSGGSSPADLIAEMDPSTTSASAGQRITFTVTDTSGSGRWIKNLEWDFGDGTTTSGWWNAHSYDSPGSYVVSLTATDNNGATTTHEVTITVS